MSSGLPGVAFRFTLRYFGCSAPGIWRGSKPAGRSLGQWSMLGMRVPFPSQALQPIVHPSVFGAHYDVSRRPHAGPTQVARAARQGWEAHTHARTRSTTGQRCTHPSRCCMSTCTCSDPSTLLNSLVERTADRQARVQPRQRIRTARSSPSLGTSHVTTQAGPHRPSSSKAA
eukprot:COSAG02_NODE_234_length_27784_cov_12.556872_3_plen_172_part_00